MMRAVRSVDRRINASAYPKLIYPSLFLLEGGFKSFFKSHAELCEPNSYVPMSDDAWKDECRRAGAHMRSRWKLFKAQKSGGGLMLRAARSCDF